MKVPQIAVQLHKNPFRFISTNRKRLSCARVHAQTLKRILSISSSAPTKLEDRPRDDPYACGYYRGRSIDFHRVGSAPVAAQPAARSSVETVETAVSAAVMIRTGGACAAIQVTYRRRRTTLRSFSSAEKFRRFNSCYLLGPICSGPESSCWKSGRLRIGSQTGSIFKRVI